LFLSSRGYLERTNAAPVLLQGTARNFLERMFTIMAIMMVGFIAPTALRC
jgi:hypothetical protein